MTDVEPLTFDITNNILIEIGSGRGNYDKDGYTLNSLCFPTSCQTAEKNAGF